MTNNKPHIDKRPLVKWAGNAIDVADITVSWNWLRELARRDATRFLYLGRGNVEGFSRLWGPAQWQGTEEWTHGWKVANEGLDVIILSNKHSSRYLLRTTDDDDNVVQSAKTGVGVVAFLNELANGLARLDGC